MLVRAVLSRIGHRRREVLRGPAVGADCAALKTSQDEVLLLSSDPITGAVKGIGGHSIHITANDLAAAGAEPVAVMITLLLPPDTTEDEVCRMMREAEEVCALLDMEILGGHTEITPVVTQPVISVTGIGKCKEETLMRPENVLPGMDLVVSKWIGLEASAILAGEREEYLRGKIPDDMLEEAAAFSKYLSIVPEAAIAGEFGAVLMHDITEGGILGALWEAAEAGGIGVDVDMSAIPIREETKRICEVFSVDPLKIMSSGSLLMIVDNGEKLVQVLQEQGIHSVVIGKTTGKGERILRSENTVQQLTPPEPDALYTALRFIQQCCRQDPEKR